MCFGACLDELQDNTPAPLRFGDDVEDHQYHVQRRAGQARLFEVEFKLK